jgi:hypothetical protein
MTIKKNHPSGLKRRSIKFSTVSKDKNKDIFEQNILKPPLPPIA